MMIRLFGPFRPLHGFAQEIDFQGELPDWIRRGGCDQKNIAQRHLAEQTGWSINFK
jgi:hypothetical protein